jgi:PPK2 family polyphosphate:nucleotide phosphotransferase
VSQPDIDLDRYRFRAGDRLDSFSTDDAGPFADEDEARAYVEGQARRLSRLQHVLHAHRRYGLLLAVQGMDASGKDEAIVHVTSAMDPQQCEAVHVHAPTEREGRHDYLWQVYPSLPARGQVAVFNRSYYERVVGDRVHPDRLDEQHLPDEVQAGAESGALWRDRLRQLRDFERYLVENGVLVRKVLLHVSKEAQHERLVERTERPEKRWDVSMSDATDRERWDDFMAAYQDALEATSTDAAPWFVVPADHKWAARAIVAAVVEGALAPLHDGFPEPDAEQRELIEAVREKLGAEG